MSRAKIKLTIFSKPECELCEPFIETIKTITHQSKWKNHTELHFINIEIDNKAYEKYWEKIPVLEINARLAFKYHINLRDLEQKLNQIQKNSIT